LAFSGLLLMFWMYYELFCICMGPCLFDHCLFLRECPFCEWKRHASHTSPFHFRMCFQNKCRNLNMPNKLVKVLPAGLDQHITHRKCNVKGRFEVQWTRQGGALKCVPLFKDPWIEGGIFCMGTLPSFLGPLTKEHPLHTSLSNWGFVWPGVGGRLQNWGWKILERESNRGMKFKCKIKGIK
jgi:hypothetical protein